LETIRKKRITIVFGTRPEAIKLALLIRELKKYDCVETRVLLTGQHREMVEIINNFFGIIIDRDFKLMIPNQTLNELTRNILINVSDDIKNFPPDLVLVQGDTTSAFASALASFYEKIPIGHVEAGLRTDNLKMPFPEELNRRLISQMSSIHFAPTKESLENLNECGIKNNVYITGNTVVDALLFAKDQAKPFASKKINWQKDKVILASIHRRENWGKKMENILYGLKKIINANPELFLVIPMHKNKIVREPILRILGDTKNIITCEPLSYLEIIGTIKNCYLLITDSGGLQEEAPTFGKPVFVLRDSTERNEAIHAGISKLVGTNSENIFREVNNLIKNKILYKSMSRKLNLFGDGNSSKKIAKLCLDFIGL
tara:strand:+ start:339 stop:1457 length:1119 start_codon:yes stop_codon:yes gene_type:complete